MLHHPTHDKLTRLKLFGMARAFAKQSALDLNHLIFEERLGLLVDHEATKRDGKAHALRLQGAKLKPNTAPRTSTTVIRAASTRRCSSACRPGSGDRQAECAADRPHGRRQDMDRHGTRSTIVTSQLPIEHWHATIGDPTLADAILDRLVHNAHQLNLKGDSLRRKRAGLTSPAHQE